MISMNWNYPTNIWFGEKRINEITNGCEILNIKNPLIVTDPGILKTNIIEKITKALNTNVNIFSEVQSNPTGTNVEQGVLSFKESLFASLARSVKFPILFLNFTYSLYDDLNSGGVASF